MTKSSVVGQFCDLSYERKQEDRVVASHYLLILCEKSATLIFHIGGTAARRYGALYGYEEYRLRLMEFCS